MKGTCGTTHRFYRVYLVIDITTNETFFLTIRLVIAPWNFFAFNFLTGGSRLYGENPWHWNFSSIMPSILASYLPLLWIGLRNSPRNLTVGSFAVLQMSIYSFSAHKEHRFLLPALQFLMPYCGLGAAIVSDMRDSNVDGKKAESIVQRKQHRSSPAAVSSPWKLSFVLICTIQLLMALYFGIFHQRYVEQNSIT